MRTPASADSFVIRKIILKGVLLHGLSAIHKKEEAARMIINESRLSMVEAGIENVHSHVVGQPGSRVCELFEQAQSKEPSILFIRSLDIFTPKRGTPKARSLSLATISGLASDHPRPRTHALCKCARTPTKGKFSTMKTPEADPANA